MTITQFPWPTDVTVNSKVGTATLCRNYITERHIQAAFRDIPFMVDASDMQGGRRNVTHQFPSSERWLNEDLGQRAVGMQVQGYVYGERVEEWAHMLFEACSTAGPDYLYLPGRARMKARCNECRIGWSADKQGRMDAVMEFVLENAPTINDFPWSPTFAAAIVTTGGQSMIDEARASITRVSAVSRPASAYAAAAIEIAGIGNRLRRVVDETPLPPLVASSVSQTGLILKREATSFAYALRQRAAELRPTSFGGGQETTAVYTARHDYILTIVTAINDLRSGALDAKSEQQLARSLQRWANLTPTTIESSSAPSAGMVRELVETVVSYARWCAVATQAMLLTRPPPVSDDTRSTESLRATQEVSDRITERLVVELDEATPFPDLQEAIRTLSSGWTRYLDTVRRSTSRTVVISPAGPLAVKAGELYGGTEVRDVQHDRQLVERNAIRHPLFVFDDVSAVVEPLR